MGRSAFFLLEFCHQEWRLQRSPQSLDALLLHQETDLLSASTTGTVALLPKHPQAVCCIAVSNRRLTGMHCILLRPLPALQPGAFREGVQTGDFSFNAVTYFFASLFYSNHVPLAQKLVLSKQG